MESSTVTILATAKPKKIKKPKDSKLQTTSTKTASPKKKRRKSAPILNFSPDQTQPQQQFPNQATTPAKNIANRVPRPSIERFAGAQFQNSPDPSNLPLPIFFPPNANPKPIIVSHNDPTGRTTWNSLSSSPVLNGSYLLSRSAGEHRGHSPIHYHLPTTNYSSDQINFNNRLPKPPIQSHQLHSLLDQPIINQPRDIFHRDNHMFALQNNSDQSESESEITDEELKKKSKDLFRLLNSNTEQVAPPIISSTSSSPVTPSSTLTHEEYLKTTNVKGSTKDLDQISRDLRNLLKIAN